MVVAIMGILATAAVPYGQFAYIREMEDQLRLNLQDVRLAIARWKEDCQKAVDVQLGVDAWKMPDYKLFPPNIGQLTTNEVYSFSDGALSVDFYHLPYLSKIPDDPFVGRAVWVQHYARQIDLNKTTLWDMAANPNTTEKDGTPYVDDPIDRVGVFDVSPIADATERRGFWQAIDGSSFADW